MNPVADFELAFRRVFGFNFSDGMMNKGLRYVKQGRVSNVSVESQKQFIIIRASVRGSADEPYDVEVSLERDADGFELQFDCTCPAEFECSHVVATLAAAWGKVPDLLARPPALEDDELIAEVERLQGKPVERSGGRRQPLTEPPSPQVERWAEQLRATASDAGEAEIESQQKSEIRFVLAPSGGSSSPVSVRVELVKERKNKLGWTKGTVLSLAGQAVLASARLSPEDQHALLVLRGLNPYSYGQAVSLAGAAGAQVLSLMLATGHAAWEKSDRLITLGPPRQGELAWLTRETDGAQTPTIRVTPKATYVIPIAPPWYIDLPNNECGPLQLSQTPEVAMAWLSAPPVAPADTRAVELALRELGFPLPERIETVYRDEVAPVPVLRLAGRTLKDYAIPWEWRPRGYRQHADPVYVIGQATLSFDYAGTLVSRGDRAGLIKRFVDGRLEVIRRRTSFEAASAKVLTAALVTDSGMSSGNRGGSGDHWCAPETATYSEHQQVWLQFVDQIVPMLRKQNWRVEIEPSFPARIVEPEEWFTDAEADGADWFDIELGIIVEGQRINLLPLLGNLLRDMASREAEIAGRELDASLRLPDGRYVRIPDDRLRLIYGTLRELLDPAALSADGRLRASRLRAADAAANLGLSNSRWLGSPEVQELGQKIQSFSKIAAVDPPAGFRAELRPYQKDGVAWLQFLREYSLAGILADDMGLGKTVMALAHILLEKVSGRAAGPSLVVAPTSLMANWRLESERFAPDLRVLILHGAGRKAHFEKLADYDLVVTSYPLLNRDEAVLAPQPFHLLILDEAQYIKNARASWAQVAMKLKATHRLAMTGTPMENHLGELWSIMNFLLPGYLGDEKQFRRLFRTPIEKHQDASARQALQRRIRPFILRRRKEQVVAELPAKTEILRAVDLSGGQRDLYETVRLTMEQRVRDEIAARGLARSHIIILDALLKLRQVCCDPRLVKMEAARKVRESAKLELLMDLLPDMIAEGRRVLLFSQFTSMLDLIQERLNAATMPFVVLTGETRDRDTPVQRFQSRDVPLFLISLKAGGTGLNLTAADTVIHYDPWWNPAVEAQATDRAHRIGQDKNVFVYKLTAAGTVEEKILALQEKKKQLLAGVLGEENAVAKLTQGDLTELFAPLG